MLPSAIGRTSAPTTLRISGLPTYGPFARCLRFAVMVAHAPRKTRLRPAGYALTAWDSHPSGSLAQFPRLAPPPLGAGFPRRTPISQTRPPRPPYRPRWLQRSRAATARAPAASQAAVTGALPPVAASNAERASGAGRPSSSTVVADLSLTRYRSASAARAAPEVPQVVGDDAQPRPYPVRPSARETSERLHAPKAAPSRSGRTWDRARAAPHRPRPRVPLGGSRPITAPCR
jgi:hypothetical protein